MLKLATKFLPTRTAFATASRAGFRCAELWLDAELLSHYQAIITQARSYPFEYALHFPNRTDLSYETLAQTAALYHELGSRCLVVHQPHYDKFRAALLNLNPEIQFAVENHHVNPETIAD